VAARGGCRFLVLQYEAPTPSGHSAGRRPKTWQQQKQKREMRPKRSRAITDMWLLVTAVFDVKDPR